MSYLFLLLYHRMFNIITMKTTWLHTIVYDDLKIPVKPLFYRIFIVISTIRVKRMNVHFWPTLYMCCTCVYNLIFNCNIVQLACVVENRLKVKKDRQLCQRQKKNEMRGGGLICFWLLACYKSVACCVNLSFVAGGIWRLLTPRCIYISKGSRNVIAACFVKCGVKYDLHWRCEKFITKAAINNLSTLGQRNYRSNTFVEKNYVQSVSTFISVHISIEIKLRENLDNKFRR